MLQGLVLNTIKAVCIYCCGKLPLVLNCLWNIVESLLQGQLNGGQLSLLPNNTRLKELITSLPSDP